MTEPNTLERLLEEAWVEAEVFALRPDYRAVLLAVDGLIPGPSVATSEVLLREAEAATARALAGYHGAPRLVRATGQETFDTVAGGEPVIEHPEPGEVVWCDEAGVTCRRWNWRQGRRTALTEDTTTALFILDALAPMTDEALHAAAEDLATRLADLGPDVRSARRLLTAGDRHTPGDPS